MKRVVFVRHGESTWNQENRFTGWTDVDLSERGVLEAKEAGEVLKKEGFDFDIAFTSVLKRAIKTLYLIQDGLDLLWTPVIKSWRLNERHYGSLQGLNKSETAAKYGEDQVRLWRRSYDVPPPLLSADDGRWPGLERMYNGVDRTELPLGESLKDTIRRVLPYWEKEIVPIIKEGQKVIIVAHGNSLRALVKHLEAISEEEIVGLNLPTGIPLVYDLDDECRFVAKKYLADDARVREAMEKVAHQGKK